MKLDMRKLVIGELLIIKGYPICAEEKAARLEFLVELLLAAGDYTWPACMRLYTTVFSLVETEQRRWPDDRSDLRRDIFKHATCLNTSQVPSLAASSAKKSQGPAAGAAKKATSTGPSILWCLGWQNNLCELTSPHSGVLHDRNVMLQHVCGSCAWKDRVARPHRSNDPKCPHNKK